MAIEKLHANEWSILGLGSIGSLWASRFLGKNIPVELLLRGEKNIRQLKEKGLTIRHHESSVTYHPTCLSSNTTINSSAIKHLLITTKAHQTIPALQSFAHRIHPDTKLILLQNGMGVSDEIKNHFPDNPLFLGITTDGAYRSDSCTVVHAGEGETWFGPANTDKLEEFSTLKAIHSPCFWETDIHPRIWQKFAINCAINGLTVLFQCKNGALLRNKDARNQLAHICEEIESVLGKKGISLSSPVMETALGIAEKTANNYSSMLQDFRARRRLELDYLNGYLCREASRLDIDVPHNQALVEAIQGLIKSN